MMTKYLILVKHSVPEMKKIARQIRGSFRRKVDYACQRLAEQLTRLKPEVIISSNEPKAKGDDRDPCGSASSGDADYPRSA